MNWDLETVLPVVWFGIIGVGVLMYVLLDGFVLGIGILAAFAEDESQLDVSMNTAAPIWDGNETWLVLGGVGLFTAFPLAYAILLPALYLPVLVMLLALIFRGVAFEFRFKARRSRRLWGAAFAIGSILTAFSQGVILGALVEGMPLQEGRYVGGVFDWFSPFSMMTGIAVVFGYALLGSTWLILKTEGRLQEVARALTRPLVAVVVAFMALVSTWLPFLESGVMARWFEGSNFLWLSPIPLLAVVNALALWRAVMNRAEVAPFVLAMTFFALGFVGLVIGMWPNLIPPDLDIWQASSAHSSQVFSLVGVIILLPIIIGYTAWSYSVFRGKVTAESGYH
ncbi:cytochrome d ubiquinol oxidase subunit II [Coralloluteibacterium thermophilus]|uniref:Cytochrome d ubiquinol oxidase subunit II n=1 Tax=Coralloluteibacterium thermophilum TaxID=2707049 RepID=A0ABV9NFK5_9GAMM